MALVHHDAYRVMAVQNLAFATASTGQFVTSTTAFSSQTYWIQICATGVETATTGVRYNVGEAATVTANSSSALLPLNWVQQVKVSPGQRLAAVSQGGATGTLSITELAD